MMNGMKYRQILDEKLELLTRHHGKTHFLQDGAVPQVRARLLLIPGGALNQAGLGNSPDLSPIENACFWMKVQVREFKATNLMEFDENLTKLWALKMDDSQYLRNLMECMPRKLKDIIRRVGNPTK
jgi:hypothetical protein